MNNSTTQKKPLLKLGILQAGRVPEDLADEHADYNRLFELLLGENDFDYHHWAVLDGVFPDNLDDMDAWLITGSRHGAYEDHSWIPPLEDLIRKVYAADKDGGWSVGRVEYSLDESVFGSHTNTPDNKTALLAFHQDQVVEAPASSRTVGSTNFCKHAALLYGNRVLSLQPHPEFNARFIDDLLVARGGILPEETKKEAEKQLHQPIVREPIAQTLRMFLQRDHAG